MKKKKTGLGRGLEDLIQDKKNVDELLHTKSAKESLIEIEIDRIMPNPNQPRKEFNEETLRELAESIKEYGIIQPIVVSPNGEKYVIVAGERRYRSAKMAGLDSIPSIIKETTEEDRAKLALIENVQREDLNPIDEALAYKEIIDAYNITQQNLGEMIGKSRGYIGNTMRLLQLDPQVIEYLRDGKLSVSHGKQLLALPLKEQYKAAKKIVEQDLTVRDSVTVVTKKKKKEPSQEDIYLQSVEDKLMGIIGTKVRIVPGKNKGKLEIDYYGNEDLERILEFFGESWQS